jgi:hypothetical protein
MMPCPLLHRFQAPIRLFRTLLVRHMRRTVCGIVVIATIATALPVAAQTGSARAEGAASQRAAAGWLQLQLDRRESRQADPAVSPSEAVRRQALETEEAIRYRELLQREERALQSLRRQERASPPSGLGDGLDTQPARSRMQRHLIELESARESQRLRMRMDRERRTRPTPPGRPGSRSGIQ